MKRILLSTVVFLLTITPAASAQISYLTILQNESSFHQGWEYIPSPYITFETYVYAYPGENGLICADFKMLTPAWVVNIGTVFNAEVAVDIDQDLPYDEDGARICLSSCATQPIWLCRVTHLPLVAAVEGEIRIIPRPSIGQVQAASCLEGNPFDLIYVLCWFGLNYVPGCWMANETSTWGAIKNIYSE